MVSGRKLHSQFTVQGQLLITVTLSESLYSAKSVSNHWQVEMAGMAHKILSFDQNRHQEIEDETVGCERLRWA